MPATRPSRAACCQTGGVRWIAAQLSRIAGGADECLRLLRRQEACGAPPLKGRHSGREGGYAQVPPVSAHALPMAREHISVGAVTSWEPPLPTASITDTTADITAAPATDRRAHPRTHGLAARTHTTLRASV